VATAEPARCARAKTKVTRRGGAPALVDKVVASWSGGDDVVLSSSRHGCHVEGDASQEGPTQQPFSK
jgi:hypothetical protein